ncbi:MAG: exosome complex protein Rrp42 [Candidatus Hydrothermarchaeota archaeon]|jgi:exosome complex component RRP42|nr:exosome complex protein Rrp42 [Candidatus Hydrothermarchaeota archaeon]
MEDIIADIKKDYIVNLLDQGKRQDDRGFDDYRPIAIETGASNKADGSALIKIGSNQVMVGVKMKIGEPFADMPASGVLMTNTELRPLASPSFEKGPPSEDSVELSRVVDRGIRESKCIDLDKLCIVEGEKVWMVFIDIHALDYKGNLFDAASLGCIAALLDTHIPTVEDGRVIYGELTKKKLPIMDKPVETTYAKIGNNIILDPRLDEELVMDSRLTVATTEKGEICAMQKGGNGTFTQGEILDIISKSKKKGKELRKYL